MSRSSRVKRRVALLVGVILVLVVGYFIFQGARGASSEKLLAEARIEGLEAHRQGDYDLALTRLSYYLGTHNDDVEALIAFADARKRTPLINNRHLMEAIRFYQEAIAHEPDNLEAMRGLLGLYERVQRRVEWMELAERILAIEPTDTEALRMMAVGNVLDGRFDDAATFSEQLLDADPDDINWRLLHLQILRQQGASEGELIDIADEWAAEWDGDGRLLMIAAQIRLSAGRIDQGRSMAIEAAERGADSVIILQQLASMLDMLQLNSHATELVRATQEQHPDEAWPHVAAVRRLWQSNRLTEAMEVIDRYEQAVAEDSSDNSLDRELLRWRALLLVQTGENARAQEVLDALERNAADLPEEERNADRAMVDALRVRLTFDTDDEPPMREVIDTYASCMALAPGDPVLAFLSGEAHQRIGEYGLAASMFATSLRSDPNWIAARLALAETLLASGQSNDALAQATTIMMRTASPPLHAYTVLVRAWLSAAQPGEFVTISDVSTGERMSVLNLLEQLATAHPDNVLIKSLYVRAALKEGDAELAGQLVDEALAWAESMETAPAGDGQDAVPADQRAVLLVELARISRGSGLGREAQLLNAAERIDGLTLGVVRERAAMLHQQGRPDDGMAIIDAYLESNPSGGDLEAARRVRAAYMTQIDHPDAVNALWNLLGGRNTAEGSDCTDGSAQNAVVVLEQPAAWQDEDLVQRAMQCLEYVVGDDSPRVVLARSRWVRTFRSDSQSEVASAQLSVNALLQRMPGSVQAMEEMAALALVTEDDKTDQSGERAASDRALAARYLEQAVNASPSRVDLRLRYAEMLQQQGDWNGAAAQLRAIRDLRQPVTAEPSDSVATIDDMLLMEVQLLLRQGDDAAIINRLSGVLNQLLDTESVSGAIAPTDGPITRLRTAQRILAGALHRSGRSEESEAIYKDLIAAQSEAGDGDPVMAGDEWRDVVESYATLLVNTGRVEAGLEVVENARFADAAQQRWRDLITGRVLWQAGAIADAQAAFQRAIDAVSNSADNGNAALLVRAHGDLATLQLSQGEVEQACDTALAGLRGARAHASATDVDLSSLHAALVMSVPGLDPQRRGDILERLVEPGDSQPEPHLRRTAELLQAAMTRNGALEPTSAQLSEAVRIAELYPQSVPAFRIALYLHLQEGRVDDAITICQQVAARLPNAVEPAERAARLLRGRGRHDEAMTAAQMWRARAGSQSIEAELFMASLALDMNDADRAYALLSPYRDRLVPTAGEEPSAQRAEAAGIWLSTLVRSGRLEDAAVAYEHLLESDETRWVSIWLDAAGQAATRDDVQQAIERITSFAMRTPRAMLALGSAWHQVVRRFDDAEAADRAMTLATQALAADSELRLASLLLRAQVAEAQGDPTQAESLYREAIAVNENNVIALNNLAYLLVRGQQQCDEAAALADRALEVAPDVPEILDTRAQAALCAGDPALAERLARRGLEVRENDRDLLITLVTALARLDRVDEARRTNLQLERAMTSAPGEDDLTATRALEEKLERMREALDAAGMLGAAQRTARAAAA